MIKIGSSAYAIAAVSIFLREAFVLPRTAMSHRDRIARQCEELVRLANRRAHAT